MAFELQRQVEPIAALLETGQKPLLPKAVPALVSRQKQISGMIVLNLLV